MRAQVHRLGLITVRQRWRPRGPEQTCDFHQLVWQNFQTAGIGEDDAAVEQRRFVKTDSSRRTLPMHDRLPRREPSGDDVFLRPGSCKRGT